MIRIRARNHRGTIRTDFGARAAIPMGWITVNADGIMWFDEMTRFNEGDWERVSKYLTKRWPSAPGLVTG